MKIQFVIQERRKLLGLTQEQIAEYLGVTTPAVNKWEKGSTCPDIALLPALARLLKIDMNTLFSFYEDITQQELIYFCKEIHEAVLTGGFDAGFAMARDKIHEYPNSDKLLYNVALQFQALLNTADLDADQTKAYMQNIEAWYVRLTQSEEAVIRNGACFMLANHAISDGRYEEAQEYLDQMPNRNDTPDKRMLQAAIYLKQDRAEEAAELMERSLLVAVNDMQMIMYKLIDANIAVGDHEAAEYVAERLIKLAEALDLSQCNTLVAPFQIAVANKDVEQTLVLLRKMLDALSSVWKVQESPLYRRIPANQSGVSMGQMIAPLLKELQQDPAFAYLHTNQEFQALLVEFETK